jgi:GTP1/Obg family GTP-binding protein
LIGGTTDEFACTEQVERELRQMEQLEKQAENLLVVVAENERLKDRLEKIDELHRKDIRAVKEEYQEQIAFLKDQLKAWQTRS